MRSGLKAVAVLLVTLPVLAYVGGRLATAPAAPGPRSPVILDGSPTQQPSPPDDDGQDDGQDDGDIRVVNPTPTRVGEDDSGSDDHGSDDDGDGDDKGPGPEGDDRTDDDTGGRGD